MSPINRLAVRCICVSYGQASQDLGVHQSQLRDRVKRFGDDPQHAFPGHGQMKPEQLARFCPALIPADLRLIVDGARPSCVAIFRIDNPATNPRDISSRSCRDSESRARPLAAGAMPPFRDGARLDDGQMPGARSKSLADFRPTFRMMRPKRISHEAIYQALFVQGRGALRRELTACLRTGRPLRIPERAHGVEARPSSLLRS
jgi:hypothetical protein